MTLFDVHAHLTHPEIAPDIEGILERARAAGVTSIVSNGLNPVDNAAVFALASRSTMVRPAIGFYPVDVVLAEMEARGIEYPRDAPPIPTDEGIAWVREHASEAFAIGEIGLDGYWVPEALWEAQENAFRELVAIALSASKPIIIHTRKRERRTFDILEEMGAERVNWHCFGGKVKLAREIADAGHWMSIPANARRHEAFTRMLETLPRERILLETDCPYLAPEPGTKSEPAHVRGTLRYAAELWQKSEEEAERQVAANYEALFGAPP